MRVLCFSVSTLRKSRHIVLSSGLVSIESCPRCGITDLPNQTFSLLSSQALRACNFRVMIYPTYGYSISCLPPHLRLFHQLSSTPLMGIPLVVFYPTYGCSICCLLHVLHLWLLHQWALVIKHFISLPYIVCVLQLCFGQKFAITL